MKLSECELYRPEPIEVRQSISLGDKLKRHGSDDLYTYVVARVDQYRYSLINIDTGLRWQDPVTYRGPPENLPLSVVEKLIGTPDLSDWEIVE